eukprot:1138373-Pelagomonas_calceolata.AAC.3
MGIWRIACHAPGRPDSPSPVLHRRAPSSPRQKPPMVPKLITPMHHDLVFSSSVAKCSCSSLWLDSSSFRHVCLISRDVIPAFVKTSNLQLQII